MKSSAGDEQGSLIEALDFVRRHADDHGWLEGFTPEARERLRDAGSVIAGLRASVGLPIPELVRLIELELRLDIELAANEMIGSARVASAQLRAFVDEVHAFLATDESGSIASLLAWLDHAEQLDEFAPRTEPPEDDVVQLLTIHGSKGLEWDAVAVVRVVEGELPSAPRDTKAWLGFGVLPYSFRGDAHGCRLRLARARTPRRSRTSSAASPRSSRPIARGSARRSDGSRTWRSPAPRTTCCCRFELGGHEGAAGSRPLLRRDRPGARPGRVRVTVGGEPVRGPAAARWSGPSTPSATGGVPWRAPRGGAGGAGGTAAEPSADVALLLAEREALRHPVAPDAPDPHPRLALQGLCHGLRRHDGIHRPPHARTPLPPDPSRHAVPRVGGASVGRRGHRAGAG